MQNTVPKILLLLTSLFGCMLGGILFSMRANHPPSITPGYAKWAASPFFFAVASLLFSLRGVLHDIFTLAFANIFLLLGNVSLVIGYRQFYGQKYPGLSLYLLVAGVAPLLIYLSHDIYFLHRTYLVCTLMLLLFFDQFRSIYKHGRNAFPTRFSMTVLTLLMLIMLGRIIGISYAPQITTLFYPSFGQSFFIGIFSICIVLIAVSSILMTSERLGTELKKITSRDRLTGIFTRKKLLGLISHEILQSKRTGCFFSLILIRLEQLREVNAKHGYLAVDEMMVKLAYEIFRRLGSDDKLGRFSSAEFAILLPNTDATRAGHIVEQIHAIVVNAADLPVATLSSAIVTYMSDSGERLEDYINRANATLQKARKGSACSTATG